MEEIRDYYAFLGVPRNASTEDIKRAYVRKRREYQNDEEKSTQLNQVYEVLCDSSKRKQYDINIQFKSQTTAINEKIRSSQSKEELHKHLYEAERLYMNILNADSENVDALWNLVGIEELLGDDTEAIRYLKQLEKCVNEGEDKLEVFHRLGIILKKNEKIDDAIKYLYNIYKADVTYVDDIILLVRLCYEDKKNIKIAIQILNDCVNRSNDSQLKVKYLCETLRSIRMLKNASYAKVEETLYKRLETFRTEETVKNVLNASVILEYLGDVLDNGDYECFHRLEQIYLRYRVENAELNEAFEALQQIVVVLKTGKLHNIIELYLEDEWTEESKVQIGRAIAIDAEAIKDSLDYIKKAAPLYWKLQDELCNLEKEIDKNLRTSKEYNSMLKDRTISSYAKKMVECLLLEGYVPLEEIEGIFIESRDNFFDKEDKDRVQYTLRKMEEYYPYCYKLLADIFFEGKSTDEFLAPNSHYRAPIQTRQNNEGGNVNGENEKRDVLIGLLVIVFIIGLCIACPPLGILFILVGKWFGGSANKEEQEELERKAEQERIKKEKAKQKRKKWFKAIVAALVIWIIWYVGNEVFQYIKQYQQEKKEEAQQENIWETQEVYEDWGEGEYILEPTPWNIDINVIYYELKNGSSLEMVKEHIGDTAYEYQYDYGVCGEFEASYGDLAGLFCYYDNSASGEYNSFTWNVYSPIGEDTLTSMFGLEKYKDTDTVSMYIWKEKLLLTVLHGTDSCFVEFKLLSDADIYNEESSNSNVLWEVSENMYNVLIQQDSFYNRGYSTTDGPVLLSEMQYCNDISDGWNPINIYEFTIVDMDSNGTNEIVLYGDDGYSGVYVVIYEYNGVIYGNLITERGMQMLQKNGLYNASGGADSNYIYTMRFDEDYAKHILLAGSDWGTYTIGINEVSYDEYVNFLSEIGFDYSDGNLADFYDYNEFNVRELVGIE